MDSETERKPLSSRNIPVSSSKLPMPGSRLKLPSTTSKRARSPEADLEVRESSSRKKLCLEKSSSASNLTGRQITNGSGPATRSNNIAKSTKNTVKRPGTGLAKTTSKVSTISRPTKPTTNSRPVTTNSIVRKPPSAASKPTSAASKPVAKVTAPTGGKKRAAWDVKGQLEDMKAMVQSRDALSYELRAQLDSYNQRIASLETHNVQLTGTVTQKEQLTESISLEITNLKKKLRDSEDDLDSTKRRLQREIDDLSFSKSTVERQKETLAGELAASRTEIAGLKSSIAELTSTQAKSLSELEATKMDLNEANTNIRIKDSRILELQEIVSIKERRIQEQEEELMNQEMIRRKLHNTIQELKGNIRVFCRVRPLLGNETLGNDGVISHMTFPDKECRTLEMEKIGDVGLNESTLMNSTRGGNKLQFTFDKVFDPPSSQATVFEEISQLVQSALDGYNVCIFAYGQTGSGKTYTMEGAGFDDEEKVGMIPRAVQQIFNTGAVLQQKGWSYKYLASMLEIYNETIRDLLTDDQNVALEIKMKGKDAGDVHVANLTMVEVTEEREVFNLLKRASHNRAVAETKCNERSSRSHSVFQLHITGHNSTTDENCHGTLSLVDLAGSERLKQSGSEGQRLKETLCINKSLSNLGNVIMALGRQDSHIPYRNSKLTYLLQNSLGGNSKTLMFVNVNPREESFNESLNSLRFATKVNQCNIGTAQKKTKL